MKFRLIYLTQGIRLLDNAPIELVIAKRYPIQIDIRNPSQEELNQGYKRDHVICSITVDRTATVKPQILSMFQEINQNKLPQGSMTIAEICQKFLIGTCPYHEDGSFNEETIPDLKYLPQSFQNYVINQQNNMYNIIIMCLKMVRWRLKAYETNEPLVHHKFLYQLENAEWKRVPQSFGVSISKIKPVIISGMDQISLTTLVNDDIDIPLGHELLREAWYLRTTHSRSSLLIGMAALETGIKHLIKTLVPDAAWLIQELPSPDILEIMKNYKLFYQSSNIPIEVDNGNLGNDHPIIPKKQVMFPSEFFDDLIKARSIRNRIVHGRKTTIPLEFLKQFLINLSSILYLVDYYSGQEWALNFVTPVMRQNVEL